MDKFALSLDDYSPHPKANNLYWANKLIEAVPNIKIDLFVPAAYCRLGDKISYNLNDHVEWTDRLKDLPKNYRINLHGLYHRRSKKDYNFHEGIESNNNEWENLKYQQARVILEKIEKIFFQRNLNYAKVFRPPGWHIGKEAVKLLIDKGYVIAGDKRYYDKYKDIQGLKWVVCNWDLLTAPPKGDIVAYGHTSDWTTNYFNEARYNTVMSVLNNNKYEFRFIEDM